MKATKPRSKKKTSRSKKRKEKGGRRTIYLMVGLAIVAFYGFIFLNYFVDPFTNRWRALYGDITYPQGYSIHGVDVSHHQGTIDWETFAQATIDNEPISFVMIKATEGKSLLDENFNDNFYQAREYGLIRGAYHFFSPSVSGKIQAKHFLHQVHLVPGDLPPILDVEEKGTLTTQQLQKEVMDWLDVVEAQYDVAPIIYTGLKFKEAYLSSADFDRYPFWIAHYYVKEVGYKGTWRFWQHTDLGRLDGIKGPVDLNIYNGSMYDLRHFTIGENEEP